MRICIDFTRLIPKKGDLYHGGGYYTYQVINGLLEYKQKEMNITILWPENYQPRIEADKKLFENVFVENNFTADMWMESYAEYDVLFLPLIDPWNFNKLEDIKKKYPKLKTVVTLHDLRIIDVLRFDVYNRYYYKQGMMEYVLHHINRYIRFAKCKKGLRHVSESTDLLMTDSNFSMQQILKYAKPGDINYFYISIEDNEKFKGYEASMPYILFVSANREEKNFIRSLEAYINAVKNGEVDIPLYVTGTGERFQEVVDRDKNIDKVIFNKMVHLLGYVSEDRMQELYAGCTFLLYTSKSEGFGLPALNAGVFGKPVVASSRTSVPEVLGSTAYYVDPYDVRDIETGIINMSKDEFRKNYEIRAREYVPILSKMMEIGLRRIIESIIE